MIGRAAVIALVAFMTLPTVVVIVVSVNPTAILSFPPTGFSLRWYVNALTYPQFQRAAVNSLLVTAAASLLALPIGTAAALALERGRLRGRHVWATLLLSPLVVPGVAAGLGFLILAAGLGLLRSRAVLIAAHVALVMPFVVRSVWVSVKNLDPMLERAAASLGATPWRTFRRVTLPLLAPGLTAGLLFAVIVSANEFVVSLFVSNRVTEILPVAMFSYVVNYTDPTIAAMSSLFIGLTFAARVARRPALRAGRGVPARSRSLMARAVVELHGCTRDFGAVRAVDALDLAVHEGELLSLLGPSGCGKTTTLNLIAGFVAPSAGRVIVDGQDVTARPPHERGLGVVFQSYALFPHMSVFENVAFGLRERRVAESEIGRRVGEALALVRLQGQGERRPAPALGRHAAARRAGAGPRVRAARPAARRAARRPRPEAARGDAGGAARDPARGRHHDRLRHP